MTMWRLMEEITIEGRTLIKVWDAENEVYILTKKLEDMTTEEREQYFGYGYEVTHIYSDAPYVVFEISKN